MKKSLVYAAAVFIFMTPSAYSLDWGLGSMITTNLENIFSKSESTAAPMTADDYRKKEDETLTEFLESARQAGYVSKSGGIDYDRINDDPEMVARLAKIMNDIEPAAGPMSTYEQPILHLKSEKTVLEGGLRKIEIER